ncbi:hypothetical protein LTS17_011492 [Exophiala oligosperma]
MPYQKVTSVPSRTDSRTSKHKRRPTLGALLYREELTPTPHGARAATDPSIPVANSLGDGLGARQPQADLNMHFLSLSAMTKRAGGRVSPQSQSGTVQHLSFPPDDGARSLATYLGYVDFRFPGIPVGKVQHGMDAITSEGEHHYRSTLSTDPAHVFMAYMVIAIVPMVSDTYPVSQGMFISTHILAESLKVLEKVFQKEDGVDVIHCLHLLVIFSIHSSTAGIAMKKSIAMGDHRDSVGEVDRTEADARRWAFWSCYFLDRLISTALGRPYSVSDKYIRVAPPSAGDAVGRPALSSQLSIHLFRYAKLMSQIVNDQGEEPFTNHLGRLLHWRACTPPEAPLSTQCAFEYQTSLYNTLYLRVAIDQIVSRQTADDAPVCLQQLPASKRNGIVVSKHQQMADFRLMDACRAVLKSLKRSGMGKTVIPVMGHGIQLNLNGTGSDLPHGGHLRSVQVG